MSEAEAYRIAVNIPEAKLEPDAKRASLAKLVPGHHRSHRAGADAHCPLRASIVVLSTRKRELRGLLTVVC
jgi:hypothetical protein